MTRHHYFIATSWNQGAVSQAFVTLGRELARRGHEVTIIANRLPRAHEKIAEPLRVEVWPNPRPVHLADAAFLLRLMRERRPDAGIANFGATNLMMTIGAALRIPVRITWYHTMFEAASRDAPGSRLRLHALRVRKSLVYRLATHIVANSRAAADDVQANFSVPADKVHVVFNSIRDPALPQPAPRDPLLIASVGRLSRSKGQETLVRALPLLQERRARVCFLGEGETRQDLEQLARTLGVADRCEFLGTQPGTEVARVLSTAAVCVVTSLEEAFGLVNIEAMAQSTPLVVSATGGIVEIVRDGSEGLHFPPGDFRTLARQLDRVLSDPALREELGRQGRTRFESVFEQTAAAARVATWLDSLTPERNRS